MKFPLMVFGTLLIGAGIACAQQQYLFTEISASSGGEFYSYYPVTINQAGTVAFHGLTPVSSEVIYTGNGFTRSYMVSTGSFSSFFPVPGIADDGTVAFLGAKYDGSAGIYTLASGGTPKLLVGSPTYQSFANDIAYSGNNLVAFQAQKKNVAGGAVYAGSASGIYTVAGTANGFDGSMSGIPTINANGTVAFFGTLAGGTAGVFISDGNTTTRLDYQTTSGVGISSVPSINVSGVLAFVGNKGSTAGVYRAASANAVPQAVMTMPKPTYFGIGSVAINQAGTVAYYVQTSDHVSNISAGLDNPVTVIAQGDTLFGSTVNGLSLTPASLNNAGQIAFTYTLQDGRSGVARANPIQPSSAGPVSTTGAADTLQATNATVRATVNPGGAATTGFFYYGSKATYGAATPAQTFDAGSSDVGVSAALTGLTPGTVYHYRPVATNTFGTTYGADGTFTTPTYAQSWRLRYFGSSANSGTGADNADPDGDGVSNLMERALGMNPTVPDNTKLPVVTRSASTGRLTISAAKGAESGDLTFIAEASSDLVNWSSTNVTVTTNTAAQFVAYDSGPVGPRRFIRLRVTGTQ